MNNNSDINYLIQIKRMLIDEIKVLETSSANNCYLNSLPIQNEVVQDMISEYISTNNYEHIHSVLIKKRLTLKNVNTKLKKMCNHKILHGNLNLSCKESRDVNYCILCMNFFTT